MDDDAVRQLFNAALYSDIEEEDEFYNRRPFLAHYTSLEALEKILATDEIWFSNPLFMNDLEEARFGIINGARAAKESEPIREALETADRHSKFTAALDYYINYFEQEHLLDTYVFCMSELAPDNTDGMLSMWRGYGGNGKGAALVFDTSKLGVVHESPLIIARVHYGSENKRFAWFDQNNAKCADVITTVDLPDDKVHLASYAIFQRIKLYALFSKHDGFEEENKWRAVYMSDYDPNGLFRHMQHYLNGPRGVEPKLRFKIGPIAGLTAPDLSLEKIVSAILLGPTTSSLLARRSVERMLDLLHKPDLKTRLHASTIPFRAT